MRDPNQQATIQRFCVAISSERRHWWVTFTPPIFIGQGRQRAGQFVELKEARKFALQYAYAKNVTVKD